MKFKRLLSFVASAAMAISALCGAMTAITASADWSGTDGDIKWTVYTSSSDPNYQTLVIEPKDGLEGLATMKDYTSTYSSVPWYSRRTSFNKVVIKEGVQNVGNYAFYYSYSSSLRELTLPSTLKSVGNYAFYICRGITTIHFTDSTGEDTDTPPVMENFGIYAFYDCSGITNLPTSFVQGSANGIVVGQNAFEGVRGLTGDLSYTVSTGADFNLKLGSTAFKGCTGITSVLFSGRSSGTTAFTEIPAYCFQNCTGITRLTLPSSGLTTIGNYAFNGCTGLTSLPSFSYQLTTIGTSAFAGCTQITSVPSLSSVTNLGQEAFKGCTGLTSVPAMPTGTSAVLGSNTFEGCNGLTTLNLSWSRIPSNCFYNCKGLTSVTLTSTSLTELPAGVFRGCTALETVDLPASITKICTQAFYGDTLLESVAIKPGLVEIESTAFQDCSSLKSITFPNSLETIGSSAFKGCAAITSIQIPAKVKTLSSNVFNGCAALTAVDLGDEITSIAQGAFANCTSLTTLNLPQKLESIDPRFATGSTKLKEVNAHAKSEYFKNPSNYKYVLLSKDGKRLVAHTQYSNYVYLDSYDSSLEVVDPYVFYQYTNITSVSMPRSENFKEIGNYAFYGCTGFSSLNFQSQATSIERIGDNAFYGCSGLTSISGLQYSKKLKYIGVSAFENTISSAKTTTASVQIGASTSDSYNQLEIGASAFRGMTGVRTFTINNYIKSFGDYAFYGDSALTTITIPDGVESIGNYAFQNCSALTTAKLSKQITSIGISMFQACTNLKTVIFPTTITAVGNNAFYGCSKLESISIPDSVTTFGTAVFQNCTGLKEVTLGSGIKSIPANTFFACTNPDLKIYLAGTISEIGSISNSFGGSNASQAVQGTIYVYDDASYAKLITINPYTGGFCNVVYGANYTALRALIASVASYESIDFTPETFSTFMSAMNIAKYTSTNPAGNQSQADSAYSILESAIATLVPLDNSEWLAKVAAQADHAENDLDSNDYRALSYADLRAAYRAAGEVKGDELNSTLKALYQAMVDAEAALVLSYEYKDPAWIVKSTNDKNGVSGWSSLQAYTYPAMEGITPAQAAGATQVKVIFDIADYVSPNNYTYLNCRSFIEGTVDGEYKNWTSAELQQTVSSGRKGVEKTFALPTTLDTGYVHHIYLFTRSWNDKPEAADIDYAVYFVNEIQLLDAEGNVLLSTKDLIVPNEDLIAAVEEAEAIDLSKYTPESAQALKDAIDAAKAILAQEKPLPSAMNNAQFAIEDAIYDLEESGDTPPVDDKTPAEKLDESVAAAEAAIADESAYTEESVQKVKDAIAAAKALPDDASEEDITAAQKAVDDAVAALVPAQSKPSSSDTQSDPSDPSKPSTNPTSATRSPDQVKKDKDAANKAMKQAKIKQLTAKSKKAKKITIKWKKVAKAVGYEVQVAKKQNFKKKVFSGTTTKKKIVISKKLKSKKVYFVRVRAYSTYLNAKNEPVKVFSKWNKKLRKVKVK